MAKGDGQEPQINGATHLRSHERRKGTTGTPAVAIETEQERSNSCLQQTNGKDRQTRTRTTYPARPSTGQSPGLEAVVGGVRVAALPFRLGPGNGWGHIQPQVG